MSMRPENYKYHLAIRLKGYDYSNPGICFVTSGGMLFSTLVEISMLNIC
jgi:hypothetical protein